MQNATGANNEKEFLGITQNACVFQGRVVGDPVVQNDNYAFIKLKTTVSEPDANGQWVDTPTEVPVITMDPKKVDVIRKYVQDGRVLLLETYYKPWVQNGQPQHAFMIKKLTLGAKKWVPRNAQPQTPGLPQ
jgi:hypothetical protein